MANRVEYIKISRIDENGNDLTNTLEALTQLTIPYSNGNNAVYPIESITRYSDYFLYQVGPANYTPNSADAGKLEYKFTSSVSTSTISHYFGFLDASAFAFYIIPLQPLLMILLDFITQIMDLMFLTHILKRI